MADGYDIKQRIDILETLKEISMTLSQKTYGKIIANPRRYTAQVPITSNAATYRIPETRVILDIQYELGEFLLEPKEVELCLESLTIFKGTPADWEEYRMLIGNYPLIHCRDLRLYLRDIPEELNGKHVTIWTTYGEEVVI